jgi:hypothetical protein
MLRVSELVLRKCMGVKNQEIVLILTDELARTIGFHLWVKARELAGEAIYILSILLGRGMGRNLQSLLLKL